MAQHDTGLGWSALEEWLVQSGNLQVAAISELVGAVVLPTAISPVELVANGLRTQVEEVPGSYTSYWIVGTDPDTEVICFFRGSSPSYTLCFVGPQNAKVYVCAYDPQSQSTSSYQTKILNTPLDSFPGFYWNSGPGGYVGTYVTLNPDIPIYTSFSDAAQHISRIENPIYKLNAGYAVACLAKWYTQNGTFITSPILISSNTEYTDMTLNDPAHSIAKLNKLLQGIHFYMAFFDLTETDSVTSTLPVVDLTDRGNLTLEQVFMTIISTSYAHVIIISSPDPYEQQTGSSKEDGSDGEEIVDDDVDFTPLPSSMAVASGFITLFCPSQYELNQLANYMWGPLFDVDTFKKLFANPMDCILGLSVYPFPISASGTKTVSVGGISTTVSMGYTLQQYHIVDCGSVYVPKQWGAYMDYAPYTRFNVFLPYIGFRPVSADDIMGKTISLRYMVDILSGACNAELKCGSTVLYSWAGSCAAQIPITGNDWRSAITAGVSIAGSVAATVLTQGASAPMIAGTVASATVNSMQLKPEVQRSGSISGSSGFLAGQRPYLVRTNPRSAIPANQNKYSGYPSFVTILLGSLTGYNEVYSVHLENIPATGAELDEIESILKGGAIF